jgi:hypothetical protein
LAVVVAVVVVPDSDGGEGDRVPGQPPQARDDVRFEGGELGGTIYLLAIGWSPDGRALLATRGHRLAVMSPEDGSVKEVGRTGGGRAFSAEWVAKEG